jgi:hypothetical protein
LIAVVNILTNIVVLDRWKMLFGRTLHPRGVSSVRRTRVQSGDDQAEIAFEKSQEVVDCQCRPGSHSCISPNTFAYIIWMV